MAHTNRADIGLVLREIAKMVRESKDPRATALSELKDVEEGNPFRILIGTILSQRTRDEMTSKASEMLFSKFKTPQELARAKPSQVTRLIKSVGFYNMKTKAVIAASKKLVKDFGGKVPSDMESLLTIPSVGRKTANCVLVYGFDKPAIPVDTHVHRISNRLGLVETKTPEQTEAQLIKTVPKRYWLDLNELFVRFGQTTCRPVGPRCGECELTARCKYFREVVRPKQLAAARAR
jgi:endonuclease III